MSVLKLRRDMVVVDDTPATDTVAESDRPFPLRKIEPEPADVLEAELAVPPAAGEEDDTHRGKTFFEHVRWWFNAAIVVTAVGVYPAMVIASSDVGDAKIAGLTNRADWTAPWVGGAASLMEQHFDQLGWASDAPAWSPMARLTAKPAYQSALAGSLGDFIKLMNMQAIAAGRSDADLEAAARLVSPAATGIQLRAARDALTNYDRRMRRRDVASVSTPQQVAQQIGLIDTWAGLSQDEIAASAKSVGGSPIDEDATRAVYAAKARAMTSFLILDSLQWPESPSAAKARTAALEAWKAAAQFHPLVVLNGDPDGSLFGNHAAAMGFLIGQAQKATDVFEASLGSAPGPVSGPVSGPASGALPAPAVQPAPAAPASGAAK